MNDDAADRTADLFRAMPLRRERVREQIADRIQEMIAADQLPPGTQLPSERDLAKSLNVNRATVREAMRLLEQRGLVEMRLGSGTFIADVSSSLVAETIERYFVFGGSASHQDLMKFREILDPEIAALAADRATAEDIDSIKQRLEALEVAFYSDDTGVYAGADTNFHESLAIATHNPLIMAVASGLHKIMHIWILAQSKAHRLEGGARSHRPIYNAIVTRDSEQARQATVHHLTYARSTLGITAPPDEDQGEQLVVTVA